MDGGEVMDWLRIILFLLIAVSVSTGIATLLVYFFRVAETVDKIHDMAVDILWRDETNGGRQIALKRNIRRYR